MLFDSDAYTVDYLLIASFVDHGRKSRPRGYMQMPAPGKQYGS
jgi:hypothetical protein